MNSDENELIPFVCPDNLNRLSSFERGVLSASGNNGTMLDQVSSPSTSQSWTLDALGNWTGDSGVSNGSESRTFNSQNQIAGATGNTSFTPTYDNNGNMTSDGTNTYIYDAWNRLVQISSGSTTETHTYYADRDMTGAFTTSIDGNTNITTFYSMDRQVIQDSTNIVGRSITNDQYVWGLGYVNDIVARDDSSTSGSLGLSGSGYGRRIYAIQDANYNVTALTSTAGTVLQRFLYSPYGSTTSNNFNWLYQFQGGRSDATFPQLYNFQNRDYNTNLGVWMEQDPTGAAYVDGMDLYQFDASGPTGHVDPSGLREDDSGLSYDQKRAINNQNQQWRTHSDTMCCENGKMVPKVRIGLVFRGPGPGKGGFGHVDTVDANGRIRGFFGEGAVHEWYWWQMYNKTRGVVADFLWYKRYRPYYVVPKRAMARNFQSTYVTFLVCPSQARQFAHRWDVNSIHPPMFCYAQDCASEAAERLNESGIPGYAGAFIRTPNSLYDSIINSADGVIIQSGYFGYNGPGQQPVVYPTSLPSTNDGSSK